MKYHIDIADAMELTSVELDEMAEAIRVSLHIGKIADDLETLPWSHQQAMECGALAEQLKFKLKLLWMTEARERAGNL